MFEEKIIEAQKRGRQISLAAQQRTMQEEMASSGQTSTIPNLFYQALGRYPTNEEQNYFQDLITKGEIQPYEVSQVLQGMPEAQNARFAQQRQGYSDYLASADQDTLNQGAQAAQMQYARMGRSGSSAIGAQVAQQAGRLANSRNASLSDLYNQQMSGLNQNYGSQSDYYKSLAQNRNQRQYDTTQSEYWYNRQLQDYKEMQQENYDRNTNSMWGQAGGALVGGVGGALLGGLPGARFGAGLVSQLGGVVTR